MQSNLKSYEWTLCLEYNKLLLYDYIALLDTLVNQNKLICAQRSQSLPKACFMTLWWFLFCYVSNFDSLVIALITVVQSCHPRHGYLLTQHKCMCCTWNVFLSCIQMWNLLLGLPESNLSSVPNPLSLKPFLQRTVWWSLLAAGWKEKTPSEKLNWRRGSEERWQERSRSRKKITERMGFHWYSTDTHTHTQTRTHQELV